MLVLYLYPLKALLNNNYTGYEAVLPSNNMTILERSEDVYFPRMSSCYMRKMEELKLLVPKGNISLLGCVGQGITV